MLLQTRIKNHLGARVVRWVDRTGIWLDQEQEAIVDGAYPTACRDVASRKQMKFEMDTKAVSICLLTNIPTKRMSEGQVKKATPKAVAPVPIHEPEVNEDIIKATHEIPKEVTAEEHEEAINELNRAGFAEGPMERIQAKLETMFIGEPPPDTPTDTITIGEAVVENVPQIAKPKTKTTTKPKAKRGRPKGNTNSKPKGRPRGSNKKKATTVKEVSK